MNVFFDERKDLMAMFGLGFIFAVFFSVLCWFDSKDVFGREVKIWDFEMFRFVVACYMLGSTLVALVFVRNQDMFTFWAGTTVSLIPAMVISAVREPQNWYFYQIMAFLSIMLLFIAVFLRTRFVDAERYRKARDTLIGEQIRIIERETREKQRNVNMPTNDGIRTEIDFLRKNTPGMQALREREGKLKRKIEELQKVIESAGGSDVDHVRRKAEVLEGKMRALYVHMRNMGRGAVEFEKGYADKLEGAAKKLTRAPDTQAEWRFSTGRE